MAPVLSTRQKKKFLEKMPAWAEEMKKKVPESIWGGDIQVKLLKKKVLARDDVEAIPESIATGAEALKKEEEFDFCPVM